MDVTTENTWETIFGKSPPYVPTILSNTEAKDCVTFSSTSNTGFGRPCNFVSDVVKVLCQGESIYCR